MSLWAKIKALFRGADKSPPAPVTTTFEYPARNLRTSLPTTTVHTRTVITESVACSIGRTSPHDVNIVIVDNVVKAISTPCDWTSARTAAQLGGESCARVFTNVQDRLTGRWQRRWTIPDPEIEDSLQRAITAAEIRRVARVRLSATPSSECISPAVWSAFIQRVTGLLTQIIVDGGRARVRIETPGGSSVYYFVGDLWALGPGPGDQRVYDLLNRYIKLNSKLVSR